MEWHHMPLKNMKDGEWQSALSRMKKGEPVYVSGRKMSQKEFSEMMRNKNKLEK